MRIVYSVFSIVISSHFLHWIINSQFLKHRPILIMRTFWLTFYLFDFFSCKMNAFGCGSPIPSSVITIKLMLCRDTMYYSATGGPRASSSLKTVWIRPSSHFHLLDSVGISNTSLVSQQLFFLSVYRSAFSWYYAMSILIT